VRGASESYDRCIATRAFPKNPYGFYERAQVFPEFNDGAKPPILESAREVRERMAKQRAGMAPTSAVLRYTESPLLQVLRTKQVEKLAEARRTAVAAAGGAPAGADAAAGVGIAKPTAAVGQSASAPDELVTITIPQGGAVGGKKLVDTGAAERDSLRCFAAVAELVPGGTMEKAGVRPGAGFVSVNGKDASTQDEASRTRHPPHL
jgi:hypothetical protein